MEFNLVKFKFNRRKKKDLLVIADFYNITISRVAEKRVIEELYCRLVEVSIFSEQTLEQVEETEIGMEDASSLKFSQ